MVCGYSKGLAARVAACSFIFTSDSVLHFPTRHFGVNILTSPPAAVSRRGRTEVSQETTNVNLSKAEPGTGLWTSRLVASVLRGRV